MEGLFLSNTGPKRGRWSYLTEIRDIYHTSDIDFPIIAIRYDKHPLFGPALDRNEPSTTRPDKCFFWTKINPPFFFEHHMYKTSVFKRFVQTQNYSGSILMVLIDSKVESKVYTVKLFQS